jgi:hypothetical protein
MSRKPPLFSRPNNGRYVKRRTRGARWSSPVAVAAVAHVSAQLGESVAESRHDHGQVLYCSSRRTGYGDDQRRTADAGHCARKHGVGQARSHFCSNEQVIATVRTMARPAATTAGLFLEGSRIEESGGATGETLAGAPAHRTRTVGGFGLSVEPRGIPPGPDGFSGTLEGPEPESHEVEYRPIPLVHNHHAPRAAW